MLETVSVEIRRAAEAEQRRRRDSERLSALVSALDEPLFELEELNLQSTAVVPAWCRRRAAELLAEASWLDMPPELPEAVSELIDRVYEAQDAALRRRRRASWGLDWTLAQVSGRGS